MKTLNKEERTYDKQSERNGGKIAKVLERQRRVEILAIYYYA